MKKKIMMIVLTACLITAAAGCSKSNSEAGTQQTGLLQTVNTESAVEISKYSDISEVTEQSEERFTVMPSSCTLKVGERRALFVQTNIGQDSNSNYTWVSDNNSVITVDSNGNITGVGEGTAVVTASRRAVTAQVNIVVEKKEESSKASQASKTESSSSASTVQSQPSVQVIQPQPQPQPQAPVRTNHFSYANSGDAALAYQQINNYLSSDYVSGLTSDDVQLLINTIYAKNGYIFKTGYIQTFFQTQYWYNNIYSKSSDMSTVRARFSSMDTANLNLLEQYD